MLADMMLPLTLLLPFAVLLLLEISVAVERAVRIRRTWLRTGMACGTGRNRSVFWRWSTTLTYLIVLLSVARLLTRLGVDPPGHPLPFVLFGLSLGLFLTLLERDMCRGGCPRKRGVAT
jgi:hypothetical protein